MYKTLEMRNMSKTFKKLFVEKYCPYLVHRTQQSFFMTVKNYNNTNIVNKKTAETKKIQKVI